MNKRLVLKISLCALFTALIAIGAFIKIPIALVPFTLQCLFTILAGMLLGPKLGCLSVICYITMGLIGIPIFTKGGGFSYIFEPTFGYIIGFLFATFITGKITYKKETITYKRLLLAGFVGLVVIYVFGLIYFYLIQMFYLELELPFWNLILYGFLLPVPNDIVSVFIAAIIAKRLIPIFNLKITKE